MKARFLLMLCVCGSAGAESWPLPPVVDNGTYPAAPAARSNAAVSTKTLFEMMGRLEQMQVEVQQLTGKVEEQTNQINELKKRQNTMYSDFDERMQSLENKTANTDQPDAEATPEPEPAPEPDEEAKAPAANPAPPPPVKPAPPAAAKPVPQQQPRPNPPAVQVAGDEKQDYQHAYDALRNGHTSQSIAEFDAFLAKYPAGGLANNAQYWLGEAHRVNQDADSARKAFTKVIDNYPGGAKVPDALLKLGYIELEQNNPDKARSYLKRVTSEFPGTSAALLASKKLLAIDGGNP
jgi:tol-pal system protein YbgF